MKTDKKNIIQDFANKQKTYYADNYLKTKKNNYLRKLRLKIAKGFIPAAVSDIRVLDIGCGPAILFRELLEHASVYTVVDIARSNLDQILLDNKNKDNIEYICADIDSMILAPNKYDLIICLGAIEYSANPYNNLKKIIRALKTNGRMVCSFPNMISPWRLWSEYSYKHISFFLKKIMKKNYIPYKRHLFFFNRVVDVLGNENLKKIDIEYFGFKIIPQPFDNIFSNLDYRIVKLFHKKRLSFLNKFYSEFIIAVDK